MPAPIADARLSLTTSPIMSSDSVGQNTLYYTDGTTTLTSTGPWSANSLYDAFVVGSSILYTNPWTTRTNNLPPTSSAGTYVGSIHTDSGGTLNCHFSLGAARRFDVWNYYNQQDVALLVVDGTANSSEYSAPQSVWQTITPNSYGTFLTGMPTHVATRSRMTVYALAGPTAGSAWVTGAIGWGSQFAGSTVPYTWPSMTNQPPGFWSQVGADNFSGGAIAPSAPGVAEYEVNGFMGAQSVYAVCNISQAGQNAGWVLIFGKNPPTERYMTIKYRG